MAQQWLHTVASAQRKLNSKAVAKIKMAILRGQWRQNGATIIFNINGELIDGQHRLKAIYESGVTVPSFVVTSVSSDEEIFHTIDDGRARSVNDFIHCKNANNVAGVARLWWMVKNKQFPLYLESPPVSDILKAAKDHLESIERMVVECNIAARLSTASSFFAFLMWYHSNIKKVEDGKVQQFYEKFSSGAGLNQSDPILLLRNRLLEYRNSHSGKNLRLTRHSRHALIMKAFYAHVDGKKPTRLVWDGSREEFPELR